MASNGISVLERSVALFKYIRELSNIKQNIVYNAADYDLCRYIGGIPDDRENIAVNYRDRLSDVGQADDGDAQDVSDTALLRVGKPEFEPVPQPDGVFSEWLRDGWDDYKRGHEVSDILEDDLSESGERFGDSPKRAAAYKNWAKDREKWAERQKLIERTRSLFTELYQLHVRLERESETLEMIVSNGFIRVSGNGAVCHPVLTKRVRTAFNAKTNTVSIEDTDAEPALETSLFHVISDISLDRIPELRAELEENGYHPMDRNDAAEYLKRLVQTITSESVFSADGIPAGWESKGRVLMYMAPAFIVRRRVSGASGMTSRVIENIESTGYLPDHIADIVSGGSAEPDRDEKNQSVDRLLADASGEDADIYLAKEANREQLEIARRIENYSAVLVQGPPGTGKTHTIANLTGHFLAQGKTVLITSHTRKALSVLKDKLPSGMQSLCVSVLDDTNRDMEKSVDGITDYMSKYTSHDLENTVSSLSAQRLDIISGQADARRRIFEIICRENIPIELNGERIMPSDAAAFVSSHGDLDIIPGNVRLYAPLPLGYDRLAELYRTNSDLSGEDEPELECGLPAPGELYSPAQFRDITAKAEYESDRVSDMQDKLGWETYISPNGGISVVTPYDTYRISSPDTEGLETLKRRLESFEPISSWMKNAAVDGRKGGSFRMRWTVLTDQITSTHALAEKVMLSQFGRTVSYSGSVPKSELPRLIGRLRDQYASKGKISKLDLMLNGDLKRAVAAASIDGHEPQSAEECGIILDSLELEKQNSVCEGYWNSLMAAGGAPSYAELDPVYPIQAAARWKESICRYLDWYERDIKEISTLAENAGLDPGQFLYSDPLESELESADRMMRTVKTTLADTVELCLAVIARENSAEKLRHADSVLKSGKRAASQLCSDMRDAVLRHDTDAYQQLFRRIETLYTKYDIQTRRAELLDELAASAPQWAEAVRNRAGVHGGTSVPPEIDGAWKYKQLAGILGSNAETPLSGLLKRNSELSREYRSVTSEYAEKSAWMHLISRTEHDIDMRQSLQGWKQTIRKIGKGTGKNAARYRAEARRLMSKCQQAVPAWIMPVGKAMESLDPAVNRFDILIIDEASQSDISALSVLYMAKKVIIVGDDRQVSPMAIGVETDVLNNLSQMYIKDVIPNSHLYDAKTSLYDIAATTFQPLMLREHFRCVPDIIGFSNMLSYDGRILPLRDAGSSDLLPAVVNFRVSGVRDGRGKTNAEEAKHIVALLRACLESPDYKNSTFGVISLLGDEQAKLISRMIYESIDIRDIDSRQILCGNASDFQGDERDVIFISTVDSAVSADGEVSSPLKIQGFGADDSIRKRYNVAVSRAKDQLWVVTSLDPASDLKDGDIRKTLIDYADNPAAFADIGQKTSLPQTATPLEKEVAGRLAALGYDVEPGRKAGGYRLDMTVRSGRNSVAVECTGTAGMTGSDAVSYESRLDMERQTILERTGWKFIRVRGSEYYLDPDSAMDRIIRELESCGITPGNEPQDTDAGDLLDRVTARARELLDAQTE